VALCPADKVNGTAGLETLNVEALRFHWVIVTLAVPSAVAVIVLVGFVPKVTLPKSTLVELSVSLLLVAGGGGGEEGVLLTDPHPAARTANPAATKRTRLRTRPDSRTLLPSSHWTARHLFVANLRSRPGRELRMARILSTKIHGLQITGDTDRKFTYIDRSCLWRRHALSRAELLRYRAR